MAMETVIEGGAALSDITPHRAESLIERCYADFWRALAGVDREHSAAFQAEANLLERRDTFRSIAASLIGHAVRIKDFEHSHGADLGCGIGLRTSLLTFLGCKNVIGCDQLKQYVEWARNGCLRRRSKVSLLYIPTTWAFPSSPASSIGS
jgi:2-polyprenyl-3-methyl-5-hydroxy-6-metoxy-1,4-benzoquinol methylase